jgi:serpin B
MRTWHYLIAAAALAACSGSDRHPGAASVSLVAADLPRDTSPAVSASEAATLAADDARFACDLYAQLSIQPGNLVFSPHSVSTALAMTYAGVQGQTRTEMAAALHFTLPDATLHAAFDAIDLALGSRLQGLAMRSGEPMSLRIVNSVWGQSGFDWKPDFLDVLSADYGTGVRAVDLSGDAEGSRAAINGWVSDQTEERIPELLPPGSIGPNARLVLVDAIALTAGWAQPFDREATAPGPFHVDATTDVTVDMMAQASTVPYFAGPGYQAVSLPYADSRLALWIVLPDAAESATLDAAEIDAIAAGLTPTFVALTVPKFTLPASTVELKTALSALGMPSAFAASSDFTPMSDDLNPACIESVLHSAYLHVDEDGTEAAAATAGVTSGLLIDLPPPPAPIPVVVDRPFVFLLRDQPTGALLFVGRVVDPS